jgi:aryl-alcohol dehydrogenase-like predicted oxidoreductase
MKYMEHLIELGKVRYIGLSNFSKEKVELANSYLRKNKVVSNQVHYNILKRKPESKSLINYCKNNNISIIAYSPLGMGLLTGKYQPGIKPRDIRRFIPKFYNRNLMHLQPLINSLKEVGKAHDKNPVQVSLNWVIRDKVIVAIPGAKNSKQVEQNCGGVGWDLNIDEVRRIENAFREYKSS